MHEGVPEKYVMIVQDMHEGARTRVKSRVGLTYVMILYCVAITVATEDRLLNRN